MGFGEGCVLLTWWWLREGVPELGGRVLGCCLQRGWMGGPQESLLIWTSEEAALQVPPIHFDLGISWQPLHPGSQRSQPVLLLLAKAWALQVAGHQAGLRGSIHQGQWVCAG